MKDQLISFETARLAKEKGFDSSIYGEHLHINQNRWFFSEGEKCFYGFAEDIDDEECYLEATSYLVPAPTQSLLQKWLREIHNIHVIIVGSNIVGPAVTYDACVMFNGTNFLREDNSLSYEDALELGLKIALTIL